MWHQAVETEAFRAAVGRGDRVRAVDAAPVRHPRVGDRRDAARRPRREIDGLRRRSRSPPACAAARSRWWCATSRPRAARGRRWRRSSPSATRDTLFSTDGSTVDEQVADAARRADGRHRGVVHRRADGGAADRAARARRPTWPAARSPTRTRPRSRCSAWIPELIERHGAVSPEVAEAMADGRAGALRRGRGDRDHRHRRARAAARRRSRSGTVCWCAKRADGDAVARDVRMPGDRNEIRDRSTTVGMHLLRRLLRGEEFPL